MNKIKFAQLQLTVPGDKNEALHGAEEALRQAVENGADFVTLPEMFCCPYQVSNFPIYAEKEEGAVWTFCADLARKNNIYLSAGTMPELDNEGHVFNTAYVFDREGKQIAKHRKAHLFDINVENGQSFQESATLTAGDAVTTFETEFCTMGLCVCYDFRFPELGRLMAMRGAEVIIVPAAFNMTTGPAHWELTFRSQALSNQVFTVGTAPAREANSCYVSWGHSIAVDPWGQVIEQMDEQVGIQYSQLDLSRIDDVRRQLPLLKHRRIDLYDLSERIDLSYTDRQGEKL